MCGSQVPAAVVVKPEATAAGGPAATAGAAVDEDVSMGESELIRSALKGLKQGSVGKVSRVTAVSAM